MWGSKTDKQAYLGGRINQREMRDNLGLGIFPQPTNEFICTTGGRQEKIGDFVKVPQSDKNEIGIKL